MVTARFFKRGYPKEVVASKDSGNSKSSMAFFGQTYPLKDGLSLNAD
jgi:hypothetical protein